MRTLRRWIGRIPGSRWAYSLLVSSPGSWIFHTQRIDWIFQSEAVRDFPALYRAFAVYCRFAPRRGGRVVGAEACHRVVGFMTRMLGLRQSASVDVNGATIHIHLPDPRSLVVPPELERSPEIALIRSLLRPGDTFVDVGANHGSFALAAASVVGTSGLVVAFEPQPHLAALVTRSLEGAGDTPFRVETLACSDYDGEAEFFIPNATSGSAGLYAAFSAGAPNRVLRVPVRRFDDAVPWSEFPGTTLIKLDVEGSEGAFLRGAERALRETRPRILMEINPPAIEAASGNEGEDLVSILLELGYTKAQEVGADEASNLRAIDWSRQRNVIVS